jgi:hypothetical protein
MAICTSPGQLQTPVGNRFSRALPKHSPSDSRYQELATYRLYGLSSLKQLPIDRDAEYKERPERFSARPRRRSEAPSDPIASLGLEAGCIRPRVGSLSHSSANSVGTVVSAPQTQSQDTEGIE